ncbi:MAG: hypothetical protein ACRDZM_08765, partial [Acidimicrobiia bacterium]
FEAMVGMGRHPGGFGVLGVESKDPVLSFLAALGLAQTAGTALVVDLCRDLSSDRTLSDIAADGPALSELSPGRTGVALIGSGPLHASDCRAVIDLLAANWPALIVRCPPGQWEGPTVPVRALLPGMLNCEETTPAVWQPMGSGVRPSGPGPILPRLRSSLARRMLSGRTAGRAKWVRAWGPVWKMPWA